MTLFKGKEIGEIQGQIGSIEERVEQIDKKVGQELGHERSARTDFEAQTNSRYAKLQEALREEVSRSVREIPQRVNQELEQRVEGHVRNALSLPARTEIDWSQVGSFADIQKFAQEADQQYTVFKQFFLQEMEKTGYEKISKRMMYSSDGSAKVFCFMDDVNVVHGKLRVGVHTERYKVDNGRFVLDKGAQSMDILSKFQQYRAIKDDVLKVAKQYNFEAPKLKDTDIVGFGGYYERDTTPNYYSSTYRVLSVGHDPSNSWGARLAEEAEDLIKAYALGYAKGAIEKSRYEDAAELCKKFAKPDAQDPFARLMAESMSKDPASAAYLSAIVDGLSKQK